MRLREAQETYEAKTVTFQNVRTTETLMVISVIDSGDMFVTALVQRINKDGSVDKRDFNQARERTFAHKVVTLGGR